MQKSALSLCCTPMSEGSQGLRAKRLEHSVAHMSHNVSEVWLGT